ncbi:MAG: dihydroorotase [Clostridiales bacterium]|nr:dihydroorotase [Clostridiales bacterium]
MKTLLKGCMVYIDNAFMRADISVVDGVIDCVGINIPENTLFDKIFDFSGKYIVPGFSDVHVHLREPGFSYKETIASGSAAGAHGGYTTVCAMPNLNPVPDSVENIKVQLDIIERDAKIRVLPYAAITKGQKGRGELVDFEALAPYAFAFSDDGKGIQEKSMMMEAMLRCKALDKAIVAHCEDESLLFGGYIHDGEYAKANGHKGICSKSEWGQIERDLELVAQTGVKYHVCHVSAKESVELIRQAKKSGINVTCETGPHYLTIHDLEIKEEGRFKMNPPIRSIKDRDALIEGIIDGTVDVIATDHAPHSKEEKSKGLAGSVMGIPGLETSFPVLYTRLVKTGIITLERLIDLMSMKPREIFDLGEGIKKGQSADITVLDLESNYDIDSSKFLTTGFGTPFEGWNVSGKILMTMYNGRTVWQSSLTEK